MKRIKSAIALVYGTRGMLNTKNPFDKFHLLALIWQVKLPAGSQIIQIYYDKIYFVQLVSYSFELFFGFVLAFVNWCIRRVRAESHPSSKLVLCGIFLENYVIVISRFARSLLPVTVSKWMNECTWCKSIQ